MSNLIRLDDHRPSPWQPDDPNCTCPACKVHRLGADLDQRLRHTEDLISLDNADALRLTLQQLAEFVGVECQYAPRQVQ